jgi:hypothetical protein
MKPQTSVIVPADNISLDIRECWRSVVAASERRPCFEMAAVLIKDSSMFVRSGVATLGSLKFYYKKPLTIYRLDTVATIPA